MVVEDLLAGFVAGPDRLKKRLQAEIQRFVEDGYLDRDQAEALARQVLAEAEKQTRRGREGLRDLGAGLGFALREVLDLPSRQEMRVFMEGIEAAIRASSTHSPLAEDLPLHDPASLERPGMPGEILPGIHVWSSWSEAKSIYFNGHALPGDAGLVVVDPVDPGDDEGRRALLALGKVERIVITNRNHGRAAAWLAAETGAPISLHVDEEGPEGLELGERLRSEQLLEGGWSVLPLPGKSPGEIGLLRAADGGQLVIGDALIGRPAGGLSLLEEDKLDDSRQLRRSLRNLIDERFDALLLGDGVSILAGADRFAHAFLRSL